MQNAIESEPRYALLGGFGVIVVAASVVVTVVIGVTGSS